jgi:hypothetical protein
VHAKAAGTAKACLYDEENNVNKPNLSEVPPIVKPQDEKVRQTECTAGLLSLLWNKVDFDDFSVTELKWLGGLTRKVALDTDALSDVAENIGSLVNDDGANEGVETGAFRTQRSLSTLLFKISEDLVTISTMASIASDANSALFRILGGAQHG